MALIAPVNVVQIRDGIAGKLSGLLHEQDHPAGIFIGKRPEQDPIHDAEDGAGRPDTQGQGKHHDGHEGRITLEPADSISNVLQKDLHSFAPDSSDIAGPVFSTMKSHDRIALLAIYINLPAWKLSPVRLFPWHPSGFSAHVGPVSLNSIEAFTMFFPGAGSSPACGYVTECRPQ